MKLPPLLNFLEETRNLIQLEKAGLPRKLLLPASEEEKEELKRIIEKISCIHI